MAFDPKLTPTQRAEIFERCLKGEKTSVLATEYGVNKGTITRIKYDPKRLAAAEKRVSAHQQFARLRINAGAMKGIEKEHEILEREVPDGAKGVSLLYLQHQVASSLMDRDGLKAPDKSEQKVEIAFSGGDFETGMPEESAETTDGEEEAGIAE